MVKILYSYVNSRQSILPISPIYYCFVIIIGRAPKTIKLFINQQQETLNIERVRQAESVQELM